MLVPTGNYVPASIPGRIRNRKPYCSLLCLGGRGSGPGSASGPVLPPLAPATPAEATTASGFSSVIVAEIVSSSRKW